MEVLDGLPVLNITIDKLHQGTDKISLVDFPAMAVDWLKFASITPLVDDIIKFNFDTLQDQQKLAGPFIIPNKPILREHPETKQRFYVVFPTEVVQEIADRFNENLNGAKFNKQHTDDVEGVYVSENWVIENPKLDKALYKFGHELPAGTWYGVVKVKNTDLWNKEILTGNLRGFSVEMLAGLKLSIDNAIIEETLLNKLEGLGEKVGKNWTLLHDDLIDENENELSLDDILGKYDFRVVAKPDEPSRLDRNKGDVGKWIVRYKYDGPKDNKNRNFCRRVLDYQDRTGKVFRKEDIDIMSFKGENTQFGRYSIFNYKGSYGCRHRWRRQIFFVDFEDDETRKVGNVPAITSNLDDQEATTDNPKPQPRQENFNQINTNMKINLALLEDLDPATLIIGAEVENENGDYTVNENVYTVVDGVITAVTPVSQPGNEAPLDDVPPAEDLEAWKMEIVNKLAELDAKVEQLSAQVSGTDLSTAENFSKADLTELFTKFKAELLPGRKDDNQADEVKIELSYPEQMAKKLAELKAKNQRPATV